MSTTRDTLGQLYTSIYDEFMLGTFAKYPMKMKEGFKEVDTKQKNYIVDDLSGLGRWEDQTELTAGNVEDPVQGYPKTYTVGKKTKQFQVSFEAVDDDEYALVKKQGQAENMGKGAWDAIEYDTAQVLYKAFSTAGPDGQYGFVSTHPRNSEETGTIDSNLLSGPFSHNNLETAEKTITDNMFDMKGIPIPITQDPVLYYPPALRGIVTRTLSERALERPGTTQRDINQFTNRKGMFQYRPVEWVYLSAALGGSDTAWYIIFPWLGYLKFVWREKPNFVSWTDNDIDAYNFKGRTRYITGYDNWRGMFGSTGL